MSIVETEQILNESKAQFLSDILPHSHYVLRQPRIEVGLGRRKTNTNRLPLICHLFVDFQYFVSFSNQLCW